MKTLGLYIHIPFCLSKCRYCDFCSFPHPKDDTVKKYISALKLEIEEYGKQFGEYTVNTVYFGGGTPTLPRASELCGLLKAIKVHFKLTENAEISAECNPATADVEYFKAMRTSGFNRLSVGVQSMNDSELKLLGRLHTSADAIRTVNDARAAGFENISVDLMFGIPAQTLESLLETVVRIGELSCEHVSLYGLKIEEGTVFAKTREKLKLPDEDTEYAMYISAIKKLSELGFEHYEISNFSKKGYASRHNLKYWQREDYLGMGLAAHSCIESKRFFNTSNMEDYLIEKRTKDCDYVSKHDILCEKIMLGMRLKKGVNFSTLKKEYGDVALKYKQGLESYIKSRHIIKEGDILTFSDEGMYVSNYILSDILDFEE